MIGDTVPVEDDWSEERARTLRRLERSTAIKLMCGALQISCNRHAILAGFDDARDESVAIAEAMNRLSLEETSAKPA